MDKQQHRGIQASATAVRVQLRLAAGDFDMRAGVLPLEPMVFSADAGAGAGVPEKEPRELVPEVPDGAGKRASGQRDVLAARGHGGRGAGDRTMVCAQDGEGGAVTRCT